MHVRREGIPMQNSFVKLLSIAGVVGIGTLVVLEVQNRLPQRQGQNPSVEVAPGSESQVQPHLVESDFDRAGFVQDSESVVYDTGTPDDLLDLAEPLGEPVDSYVDPDALTDGVDPFADVPPQSSAVNHLDSSTADTVDYETSIPVQPAAFRGEPVPNDDPLDDPLADDTVDVGLDSFDEPDTAVASTKSDSLSSPPPETDMEVPASSDPFSGDDSRDTVKDTDPFAGMDVLDEPFEDDSPSTPVAASAPKPTLDETSTAASVPAGRTGHGTNQLMFLSPRTKRDTPSRFAPDDSAHLNATSAASPELKTASSDDDRSLDFARGAAQ